MNSNLRAYSIGVTALSIASGATLFIPQVDRCIKTEINNVAGGTLFCLGSSGLATIADGRLIPAGGVPPFQVDGPAAFWLGVATSATTTFALTRYFSS